MIDLLVGNTIKGLLFIHKVTLRPNSQGSIPRRQRLSCELDSDLDALVFCLLASILKSLAYSTRVPMTVDAESSAFMSDCKFIFPRSSGISTEAAFSRYMTLFSGQ